MFFSRVTPLVWYGSCGILHTRTRWWPTITPVMPGLCGRSTLRGRCSSHRVPPPWPIAGVPSGTTHVTTSVGKSVDFAHYRAIHSHVLRKSLRCCHPAFLSPSYSPPVRYNSHTVVRDRSLPWQERRVRCQYWGGGLHAFAVARRAARGCLIGLRCLLGGRLAVILVTFDSPSGPHHNHRTHTHTAHTVHSAHTAHTAHRTYHTLARRQHTCPDGAGSIRQSGTVLKVHVFNSRN